MLLAVLVTQDFPPKLPDGKDVVTDTSPDFLKAPATLRKEVTVAKTPPTVDFMFFPGQTYRGNPWSAWGDSMFANGKYYTSVGDHLAPAGNGFVYEYDPATKKLRPLVDVRKLLQLPDGHYTPGKVHSRLTLGEDGWIYFSTHRGSTKTTTDQFFYKGDWILRTNPSTGASEILACGPVPKHCIPTGQLDPKRLIFYGGTAPGTGGDAEGVQFFAFDAKEKKVLFTCAEGPARAMILARSTGRVYWVPGKEDMTGALVRWDPAKPGPPEKLEASLGLRAATEETADGMVYTVSRAGRGAGATLWSFNTKTEKSESLGPADVGSQSYITTLDLDPSGRYVYYCPGAHGGSEQDGTPIVQFDVKSRERKVIAFLHPFYKEKYGAALKGTYSMALDDKGETLYVTWNTSRGSKAWDSVSLAAIHIPASERAGN